MRPVATLAIKEKIPRELAKQKIIAHALYGVSYSEPRLKDVQQVEMFLRQHGVDVRALVDAARRRDFQIPFFEELSGHTWNVVDGRFSVVNEIGEAEVEIDGPGLISTNTSASKFEAAVKARDRAIQELDYHHVHDCLAHGFASIEAFLNRKAAMWNRKNPAQELLDIPGNRVTLDEKILEWIPIMSDGNRFDCTNRQWSDFCNLKRIRDRHAMHPDSIGQGMSYQEMAVVLNSFRHGVANLLGNVHLLLGSTVPAVIINAIYFPDVIVVKRSE